MAGSGRCKGKVLVVDDSAVVLEATRIVLEEAGFEVATLESAMGLGTTIAGEQPDLVLMDINMPDFSGIKVLELSTRTDFFQDFFEARPVVLYSDLPEDDLAHLVRRFGAAGHIKKTEDERLLVSLVEKWISRSRSTCST